MTDLIGKTALVTGASRRIGRANDVADVITFLASDAARWVSDDSIQAGGGSKL
jgi:3-oxoacyl-[acyl-carrier protein] reductase